MSLAALAVTLSSLRHPRKAVQWLRGCRQIRQWERFREWSAGRRVQERPTQLSWARWLFPDRWERGRHSEAW